MEYFDVSEFIAPHPDNIPEVKLVATDITHDEIYISFLDALMMKSTLTAEEADRIVGSEKRKKKRKHRK